MTPFAHNRKFIVSKWRGVKLCSVTRTQTRSSTMLQLSENGNEVCGFPEGNITANSLYEHERVYNLSRCLDRIICAWLASLLLGIHTHPSFRSLHRDINIISIAPKFRYLLTLSISTFLPPSYNYFCDSYTSSSDFWHSSITLHTIVSESWSVCCIVRTKSRRSLWSTSSSVTLFFYGEWVLDLLHSCSSRFVFSQFLTIDSERYLDNFSFPLRNKKFMLIIPVCCTSIPDVVPVDASDDDDFPIDPTNSSVNRLSYDVATVTTSPTSSKFRRKRTTFYDHSYSCYLFRLPSSLTHDILSSWGELRQMSISILCVVPTKVTQLSTSSYDLLITECVIHLVIFYSTQRSVPCPGVREFECPWMLCASSVSLSALTIDFGIIARVYTCSSVLVTIVPLACHSECLVTLTRLSRCACLLVTSTCQHVVPVPRDCW